MVKVESMIVAARLAECDSDSLSLSRLTVRALPFYFKPSMLLGLEPLLVEKSVSHMSCVQSADFPSSPEGLDGLSSLLLLLLDA